MNKILLIFNIGYSQDTKYFYTFPNDEDGVKGKIVYESDSGETKEYDTEWTESTVIRRLLEWNGKELFPKIEPEKAQ